jgi:hypothetical protein
VQLPVIAFSDRLWASRMREICTSGSTRGEEHAALPYSTGPVCFASEVEAITRLLCHFKLHLLEVSQWDPAFHPENFHTHDLIMLVEI